MKMIALLVALIIVVLAGCTGPVAPSIEPAALDVYVDELGQPDRIVDNPYQSSTLYTWYGRWTSENEGCYYTKYTVEITYADEVVGAVYHGEVCP